MLKMSIITFDNSNYKLLRYKCKQSAYLLPESTIFMSEVIAKKSKVIESRQAAGFQQESACFMMIDLLNVCGPSVLID